MMSANPRFDSARPWRWLPEPSGWTLPVVLLIASCVYPTEKGQQLEVVFEAIPPLIEGESAPLVADVQTVGGTPVSNAVITFATSDQFVAVVDGGELIATGPGSVEITATVLGVAGAEVASQTVRIHGAIEIDSISPAAVRYGELVSVYGAGLHPDSLFLVTLGNEVAPVEDYLPLSPDQPFRFGRLRIWARHPARLQQPVRALGFEGLTTSPDTVRVFQFDVYEPNDTVPHDFGPNPAAVRNPALAFERVPRDDSTGVDWYRFTTTSPGDRTILIASTVGPQAYEVFVTDDIRWNGLASGFDFGPTAWAAGPSLLMCQGVPFAPLRFRGDSVVVALQNLPAGQYDVFVVFERQGAYEMSLLPIYRSTLAPDAAEENDYCDRAAPLQLGARQLTIDNPHDTDWFRISFPDSTNVTLDVAATDPAADLDVYLLRDFLPDSLSLIAVGQIEGVADALQGRLPAGDYFVLVTDFVGIPTAYTLTTATPVTLPTTDHPTAGALTLTPSSRLGGSVPTLVREQAPSRR